MNLLRLSECVLNMDRVDYMNLYLEREKPMIQVCFGGDENYVNIDNAQDISLLKQFLTAHAKGGVS